MYKSTDTLSVLSGFDRQGRPLLLMRPGRQNTKESPRMVRYTVWFLERCIDLMPPGVEQLDIILDVRTSVSC